MICRKSRKSSPLCESCFFSKDDDELDSFELDDCIVFDVILVVVAVAIGGGIRTTRGKEYLSKNIFAGSGSGFDWKKDEIKFELKKVFSFNYLITKFGAFTIPC